MQTPQPFGEMLLQELRWIHGLMRRDLATVHALVDDVLGGLPVEEVRAQVSSLQTNSPLWKIRTNCLHYCRHVHGHHSFEDLNWFPAIRRVNPELTAVVDTLEADHRQIGVLLDEVVASANALTVQDSPESRARMVSALTGLGEQLLAHLAYEEASVGPALQTWSQWPND